ncbi:MAG: transcription termination factor NusA [Spirochaetia bacterium]|nr:transcription termination factor NusA [Spirochaetia bacterium]
MARIKAATGDLTKNIFDAVQQIVSDKGFDRDEVLSIIEIGMIAAYKRKYKTSENVRVVIDKENERIFIIAKRRVVDDVIMSGMQVGLEDARKINPDVQVGDEIEISESPDEFGRISVQSAMQVVAQKLRYLEQNRIRNEYIHKLGELINGYILRKKGDTVYIDLGKVEAIMPVKFQIPGERYRVEDKIKVVLHTIEEDPKTHMLKVLVSRADKKFVQKLFEMEVPEIYDGIVNIVKIGRIPGIRTKVVVSSQRRDVDPVGACVGVRGVRIQAIVRELGNERIDIVEFSENSKDFINNALSPVAPTLVKVDFNNKEALAVVSDKDLSLAIGKDGSNVKLASSITGFKIDVKSESQFSTEMASPEARGRLDDLFAVKAEETHTGTPLTDLPGLTRRMCKILGDSNIRYLEDLINLEEEDLVGIEGIGEATAKKIMEIISENVEFEETDDAADDDDDEEIEEKNDDEQSVESTENKP